MGTCRRDTPGVVIEETEEGVLYVGRWPLVKPDDWCGRWKRTLDGE
jgi:hypothetical protein